MQLVLLDHLNPHWLKRPQPDMQRDLGDLNPTLSDLLQYLRREVQAGCGGSYRTSRLGVDRLILLAIGGRVGPVDVRRQRDVADPLQHGKKVVTGIEAKLPLAEAATADDLRRQFVRRFAGIASEVEPFPNPELAAGMHQRLPFRRRRRKLFREQDLHLAAEEVPGRGVLGRESLGPRATAMAEQACRQYARVVNNQ